MSLYKWVHSGQTKCKFEDSDGICAKLSDKEVSQPCVKSPCEYEEPMTDTEKDIAAIDIGIKAIERNKAAIEEINKTLATIQFDCYAGQARLVMVCESILKILEGEQ
jgi:hypothetical protein